MGGRIRSGLVAVVAGAAILAGCGEDEGGTVTLNWWAYNEPSGSFREAAERCTRQSQGRYRISFNPLGNDADTQRQQLVRRLAAKDSSIDLMSMDVIWTAEFAEAGWVKPWPDDYAQRVREGTLQGPIDTAMYQGQLYAAPANTNTQLLWYREDLVEGQPPGTWDALIETASNMEEAGQIEIQGAAYEGMTVWFNSVIQSAGGQILDGPTEIGLAREPTTTATGIISKFARSPAANPALENQREDQNRLAFESGEAAFQINYPFIYPSAEEGAPEIFENLAWAPYPSVEEGGPSKAPIGGFNWGVGGYTEHPELAFEAALCLRNEENQRAFALQGGLPPTLASIYDDPKFVEQYPFADLIRRQLEDPGVRPKSPLYADVSLAVYTTLSPPAEFDPDTVYGMLRDRVERALESQGLL